jgi:hypothetical protein
MTSNKRLFHPLSLPVEVLRIDGTPKITACGIPIIPFNFALKYRQLYKAATDASLNTYVRAAKLYVEFAAHLNTSIFEITNQDFRTFMEALQGRPFRNSRGVEVRLNGIRSKRTADLAVFLSHSTRNYGQRISYQTPHTVIKALREQLEEPWSESCTLHTLRHRYGIDLQEHLGSAAIAPNMRHRSLQSIKPYSAGVEVFAKQLLPVTNARLERVISVVLPRTGKDQDGGAPNGKKKTR